MCWVKSFICRLNEVNISDFYTNTFFILAKNDISIRNSTELYHCRTVFIVIQEKCPLKNWKVHKIINLQIHHKQEYILHSSLVWRIFAPKRMFRCCGGMWEFGDNITFTLEESRLHDMDHKRYYSNCKMWNVFTFFFFVLWKWFNVPLPKIYIQLKEGLNRNVFFFLNI